MPGRPGQARPRWVRRFSLGAVVLAGVLAVSVAVPAVVAPGAFSRRALVVWHFLPEAGPFAEPFGELAAAWETSGSGRTVEFVALPGNLAGLIATTPASRRPDVLLVIHTAIPALVAAGWAQPVEPPGPDVAAAAARAVVREETAYGVPFLWEGPALIYDPDALDRPPATLDDLAVLVRDGKARFDPGDPYLSLPMLAAFGGTLAAGPGAPGGVAEWLAWLAEVRRALPADRSYAAAMEGWAGGTAALILGGPWALDDLEAAGRPVAVAPYPRGPAGPARPLADVQVAVVTGARPARRAEALAFAALLAEPGRQAAWAAATRMLPADARAYGWAGLAGDPVPAGFREALRDAEPLPAGDGLTMTWFWLADTLEQVLDGGLPPERAARELLQRLAQAMSGGTSP